MRPRPYSTKLPVRHPGATADPPGRILALSAAGIALSALLIVAQPAVAGFPGTNGPIAYVSDGKPALINDDIYVTTAAGSLGLPMRLTSDPAIDRQPAVSPNGKEIAFFSTRPHGDPLNPQRDSELYVMEISDDDGDGEGDHLRRITDNTANDFAPAWSPDGRRIAFTSNRDGDNDIYTMDPDICDPDAVPAPECPDPEVVQIINEAIGQPALSDQFPVFSPDGASIAYQRAATGANPDVYVTGVNGVGAAANLTSHPALDALPDFAPDGTRLTFSSNRDGGDVDIFSVNLDGTNPVNLTPTRAVTNDRWSSWSPEGASIVFWSGIGNGLGTDAELWTVPASGGEPSILTLNQAGDAEPDWGPARVGPRGP